MLNIKFQYLWTQHCKVSCRSRINANSQVLFQTTFKFLLIKKKNKTGMLQGAIKWRPQFQSASISTDNNAVTFYCPALGNAFRPVSVSQPAVRQRRRSTNCGQCSILDINLFLRLIKPCRTETRKHLDIYRLRSVVCLYRKGRKTNHIKGNYIRIS